MGRLPFIAGNWKMHMTPAESATLAEDIAERVAGFHQVTVALFPTALSVPAVLSATRGTTLAIGIQEIEVVSQGAYTGSNSPTTARSMGCEYFLVGHSERRLRYCETDDRVAQRLRAGLDTGLLPVLCVGESLAERKAGTAEAVVCGQLQRALHAVAPDQMPSVTIAYEPVWAIGTGETATPKQAQDIHACIRAWLTETFGSSIAAATRLQYGGSVNAANAADLLSAPDIDGALVGGASLNPAAFTAIVTAAISA